MYCPKCGFEIEEGQAYCSGCNRPVQELFGKECTARCFICGEPLNAGDEFCRGCGNSDPMIVPLDTNADGDGTYCWECGAEFIGGKCPNCCLDEEDFCRHIDTVATTVCKTCGDKIVISDKFCHTCGNENSFAAPSKAKAIFCKYCGIEFELGECPICGAKEEDAFKYADEKVCPHCHEFIDEYAHFCPSCGNPADKKSSEDKSTKERPRHRFVKTTYNNLYDEEDIPDPNTILWFILGFLQLVICCNPFGIGTIICTHKADKLANAGKMKAANRKIRAAKIWFFIGLSIAAVAVTVFLLMAGL